MVDPLVATDATEPWIFDSGPLSHFAKAGWLGLLKLVAGEHPVIVPDTVHTEFLDAVGRHPHLSLVLDATASWIRISPVEGASQLVAFAKYSGLLVGNDGKNLGECGVLALAETLPATAIIDDGAARKTASTNKVALRGTVGLLLDAVRDHGLPRDTAGAVADDLLATAYRLPFEPGLFIRWATENGHLDYE